MSARDLPAELGVVAMNQGIAFFAAPDDLGLPVLGHEGVLSALSELPRDETVVLLAHLSTMLHAFGETGRSMQVEGVQALGERMKA